MGIIVFLGCCITTPLYAQFIDLNLNIDAKLTATTEHPLNFGTVVKNSGKKTIDFGSLQMGIFSVTALENEMLLVRLNRPDKLLHSDPAIKDTIPLRLSSRYGYFRRNYENSFRLSETNNVIKVNANSDPGPWNTFYIFVYGSINIGNIPDGIYSNDIVLDVEYL